MHDIVGNVITLNLYVNKIFIKIDSKNVTATRSLLQTRRQIAVLTACFFRNELGNGLALLNCYYNSIYDNSVIWVT